MKKPGRPCGLPGFGLSFCSEAGSFSSFYSKTTAATGTQALSQQQAQVLTAKTQITRAEYLPAGSGVKHSSSGPFCQKRREWL
jgi:hypothetical protein